VFSPRPIGRSNGCELMLGCIAYAETEEIVISEAEKDTVADVRWFTFPEVILTYILTYLIRRFYFMLLFSVIYIVTILIIVSIFISINLPYSS
jgi:hypothetical protein